MDISPTQDYNWDFKNSNRRAIIETSCTGPNYRAYQESNSNLEECNVDENIETDTIETRTFKINKANI